MTTFVFSNSLHYIKSIWKVVPLVMVMIGMNYFLGGHVGLLILLDLW